MDWWVWLLIALGVILVIALVIFLVVRTQSKPKEVTKASAEAAREYQLHKGYRDMILHGTDPEEAARLVQMVRERKY